jgi:hypothetical protein
MGGETNCLLWNVVSFLDDVGEQFRLRKVGGGYIFVHRLLFEYFVARDESAPTISLAPVLSMRE